MPPGILSSATRSWASFRASSSSVRFCSVMSVAIVWRNTRLQADRLSLKDKRYIEAEGNVLIVWEGNRIFGERMTYDLEEETGVIEGAMGQLQSDFIFWSERAEKIGAEIVRLKSATITTCTQPIPYWAFKVSTATIRIDKYARMWNLRFETGKVPLVYIPYMIFPVKADRAAGLLFPEFHSTRNSGQAITQELFIPLGRRVDLTELSRN